MKRKPKNDYKKIVLRAVALGGILVIATIAPNCLQLLQYTKTNKRQKKYYINSIVYQLIRSGYLKYGKNYKGQNVVNLTKKGNDLVKEYELAEKLEVRNKKWDGNFRIIIFDIKEYKRHVRDQLRNWLIKIGMYRLQNSVWVYPYDCEDIITLLKANYKIGNEVIYLKVSYIENDKRIRGYFNLK